MSNTIIVSGFPGVGKSKATGLFNDPYNGCFVTDSDSSKFSKDDFPQNYLEHIYYQYHSAQPTVLFVSSHELVRMGLVNMKLPFYLAYPAKTQVGEYIQRFIDRGSPPAFVDLVYKNWNEWVDDCAKQPGCTKIELRAGQYLSDVLGKMLTNEQNDERIVETGMPS
jgi:hypothetical protein